MSENDPFRDLLRSLQEGNWQIPPDEAEGKRSADNGGESGTRGPANGGFGGGGQPQGNPRMLWWVLVPFIVLILFNQSVGYITDWLWYGSLELTSVFYTRIWASVGLFAAGAAIFWIFLAANVLLARRLEPSGLSETPVSQVAAALGIRVTPVILLIGGVLALFMGSSLAANWESLLLYLNQSSFDLIDPVFGRDVSFFVFTLPIWQLARNWLLSVLVLTLIATALVSGIGWRRWDASAAVRGHLSALGALILLLIAWQYRLDAYQLVYSTRGAVFGAGYTDVNAQLPAYNLLTFVTLITAALLIVNVFLRRAWRAIVVVLVIWVGAAFLAGNVYPGIVQRFQVAPNEFTREQPFIEDNIRLTRIAFGLDDIVEENYNAENQLTAEGLLAQPETISNIRLWDYRPLLQTYNQVQALRQQYSFTDIDIDRYEIDGEVRQLMLSARELIPSQLEQPAQTWVNRKLVYTHGYGVAASPVAEITPDGLPTFVLKDLPTQGVLDITQPQIYFGERTDEYVIVKTDTMEFDYPRDQGGNAFTTFEGSAGVKIGNFLPRLAFALRFADINLLISEELNNDSELLWRRNITERVEEVAPFLGYDNDPYIVIGGDGKLYWFIDAYTVSYRFPYSEPSRTGTQDLPPGFNYIRNPVKVVVDAYNGDMKFYLVEEDEPIAAAYAKIFPALFTSYDEMPDHLRDNIRYPNDLFTVQASMLRTYQMTNPNDFYNREDVWAWPEEIFDNQSRLMEPYYVLMQLPNSQDLDFIQILPFTPANRENMISWLAAQSDPDKYGEKILYRFGKDSLNFGPKQIEARIDQDPVISSQLSLWNQQGSQVIRGNLLVIPVGESLLYVEPLYLQAATGKIPELKRVILATSDRVVMRENLGLALAELFGRDVLEDARLAQLAVAPGEELPADLTSLEVPGSSLDGDTLAGDLTGIGLEDLILQANGHYESAQINLQNGDWTGYGAEMDALQQVLERMAEVSGLPLFEIEATPVPVEEVAPEATTEP